MALKIELPLPDHACRNALRMFCHAQETFFYVTIDIRKIVGERGRDRGVIGIEWVEDLPVGLLSSEIGDDTFSYAFVSLAPLPNPWISL